MVRPMPSTPSSQSSHLSQLPDEAESLPPENYRPVLVDAVPLPGTNVKEVFVKERDSEESYGPAPAGCSPAEVAAILVRFFDAWSRGNGMVLKKMLAPETKDESVPLSSRAEEGYFTWFGINPTPGGIAEGSGSGGYTVASVLATAAARHEKSEVIQVLRISYGSASYGTGIDLSFDLARDADDIPAHLMGGKGAITCNTSRITVASIVDQPRVPPHWFCDTAPVRVR